MDICRLLTDTYIMFTGMLRLGHQDMRDFSEWAYMHDVFVLFF